ncbi:MAG: hypothetical protein MI741_09615, partial [Rhodospirillales bacterium]|nr:hypothetical protein [Rhodospirillales bacterium]
MKPKHWVISFVIVAVLGMQVAAYFTGKRYYPFIDFPMYNRAFGPPVECFTDEMHAEMPDGRWINVSPTYMGIKFFAWQDVTVLRIISPPGKGKYKQRVEEHRIEARQRTRDTVANREGQSPVALHFRRQVYRV